MVFPDNTFFYTFDIVADTPVVFTFPNKKPKKIFFDTSSSDFACILEINNIPNKFSLHYSKLSNIHITSPVTIDSIKINSTNTAQMGILIEEWGN